MVSLIELIEKIKNQPPPSIEQACLENQELCQSPDFWHQLILASFHLEVTPATREDYIFLFQLDNVKVVSDQTQKIDEDFINLLKKKELNNWAASKTVNWWTVNSYLHFDTKRLVKDIFFEAYSRAGFYLKLYQFLLQHDYILLDEDIFMFELFKSSDSAEDLAKFIIPETTKYFLRFDEITVVNFLEAVSNYHPNSHQQFIDELKSLEESSQEKPKFFLLDAGIILEYPELRLDSPESNFSRS